MSLNPATWPVAGKLALIIGVSVLVIGGGTAALVAANPVHITQQSCAARTRLAHPDYTAVQVNAACNHPAAPPAAAEPGVNTYLCQGTTNDTLLQWQDSGGYLSGTFQQVTLSGSPPDEQASSSQGSVTGTLNGTAITLQIGDLQPAYGTLSGGQLTINIPQQDGTIRAATCNQASIDDWNSAVSALDNRAANDNGQAQQASASASAASASAAQESSSKDDLNTLKTDSLSGDVSQLAGDVTGTDNEPFPSWLCLANLQYVDGLRELTGAPGAAAELAENSPGLELGVRPLAGRAESRVRLVGLFLGFGLVLAPVRDLRVRASLVALIGQRDQARGLQLGQDAPDPHR
jgi:hypothetical protein